MNTFRGSQRDASTEPSQNSTATLHDDLADPTAKDYSAYRLRFGTLKPGAVKRCPPLGSHLLITCRQLLEQPDSQDATAPPRNQLRFKGWVTLGPESAKSAPPDSFLDDIHSVINTEANRDYVDKIFSLAAYELEHTGKARRNYDPEIFAAQKPVAGFRELYEQSKSKPQASDNPASAEEKSAFSFPVPAQPQRRFNVVHPEFIDPPPNQSSSRKESDKCAKVCPPMDSKRAEQLSESGYELPSIAKVRHDMVWENPDGTIVTVGTQTLNPTLGTVRETEDAQGIERVQQDLTQGSAHPIQKYHFTPAPPVSLVIDPITGQKLPSWSLATGGGNPADLDLNPWYSSGRTLDQELGSQLASQGTDLFGYAIPEGDLPQYGLTVPPAWQSGPTNDFTTPLQTQNSQNLIQAGAAYDRRQDPGAPTDLLGTNLGGGLGMAYRYGPDGGSSYENVYGEPSLQAGPTQVPNVAMNQHSSYATAAYTPLATDTGLEHRLTAESASWRRNIGTDATADVMYGQSTNAGSPTLSQPITKRRKRDAQVPSSFMSEFQAGPNPTPTFTGPRRNRGTDVRIVGSDAIPQDGQESVRHGSAGLSTNPATTPGNPPQEPSDYAANMLQGHERIGSLRPSLYQHSVMPEGPTTIPASIGSNTRESRDSTSLVFPAPEGHGKRRIQKPRK